MRKRADYNDWIIGLARDGSVLVYLYGNKGAGNYLTLQTSPGIAPLNQWTKIATWYDGTTLHLFVNDTEVAHADKTLTLDWAKGYVGTNIGNNTFDHNADYAFDGDIDEIIISTRPPN